MPQLPGIYISYGMAKSGSTLAFELTRTILELSGNKQERLSGDAVHPDHPINFVHTLDKKALEALRQETALVKGTTIIKTHSSLRPHIAHQLAENQLIGHATCRDPRDIALSMLDAAREGRAWGSGPEGPFRTVQDTIPRIRAHIRHFLAWAHCPNILPLHYEELAFDTETAVNRIARQLGADVDAGKVVDLVVRERFTQKNRGVPQRWKTEMRTVDAMHLKREFSEFIGNHCPETPAPDKPLKTKKSWFSLIFSRLHEK